MKRIAFCLSFLALCLIAPLGAETAVVGNIAVGDASDGNAAVVGSPAASIDSALFPAVLAGVWERSDRFVEFSADGKLRIVLKPYYGFVYEDTGWMPCTAEPTSTAVAPSSAAVFRLAVRYTGDKYDQLVPVARVGEGLYFRFLRKYDPTDLTGASSGESATGWRTADASGGRALSTPGVASGSAQTLAAAAAAAPTIDAGEGSATVESLQGYWLAEGNADAIRLYRSAAVSEFFCYGFSGSEYVKVRYWVTDARYKPIQAVFATPAGTRLAIPKFIRVDDLLYTCVSSTGTTLRNFETGSWKLSDGALTFAPRAVVFTGTAASLRTPLAVHLSADGQVLALGEPYVTRSKVTDLDAEITAHNGLRRPPRKPIFDYMDLDFHWDEIERIRNGGKAPAN